MKIIYLYQYFSTPKGSWGTRVYEFAKRWVEQGHEVTVVTSIYYKSDLKPVGLVSDQEFDGIKVKVLNIYISNKQSILKRILTFIQYVLLSSWYVLTLPADVVVASSGPITVGVPGLIARYLKRRKFVFEVRDLWPEGAVQLGIIRNPFLKKVTYWFEKTCYKAASLIITLSPDMSEYIRKKYGFTHLLLVPNAADNDLFGTDNPYWKFPDWVAGRKIAIYAGNIGQTNNSLLLLNAAKLLSDEGISNVLILLIGDGQQREQLEQKAAEFNLTNFRIFRMIPKSELVAWIQHAMCSLVAFKGIPALDTCSPNKLFDSLAAGVPVVQTTKGWIRKLIDIEKCGLNVCAENSTDLADTLKRLAYDESLCIEMGRNARRVAREKFDRNVLSNQMLEGLIDVLHK